MARSVKSKPSARGDDHDHGACISDALSAAADLCLGRGTRLTELRRRVLGLVWASHRPIGAYEVLAKLGPRGRKAAPPTVYRALDFLLEHGLVHRVESRNAFIGCAAPGHGQTRSILICGDCGSAAEIADPRLARDIATSAATIGFEVRHPTIEVLGLCRHCRQPADIHA
jgi:Fur family zinc uptake transcriptional regulator